MKGLMQDTPLTLVQAFVRAERHFADRAIVTATTHGVERTTYGQWAARTRRLAGVLTALGVGADARVGTLAWNTARHLELYFAAPCTGRVLHTLNPRLFPEQLAYVINHAEDDVIFVDRSLLPVLWPLMGELPTVRHVVVMDDGADAQIPDDPRVLDYERLLAHAEPLERFEVADENAAAAMCYTSGTTGNPKGVVYSHRSATLHAMATMFVDVLGLRESDVVLPVVPMFHANAWGLAHAAPMSGATLVLPGSNLAPAAIAALIEQERVTLTAGVPTIWMALLPELEGRDISSLDRIVCGGSAVPKALSEGYRKQIGRPLLQAWGMTETSPLGSVAHVKSTLRHLSQDEQADLRATVGIPVPLVEARVVGTDDNAVQPWDGKSQGELQVRGPWIAREYYNAEAPAETFSEDGWLRTGDVATIDAESYIRLVDRTKDVIKSGGEWISSVELENEIMADERVAEAAVIGVIDAKWGERPLACVVPAEGVELSVEDVRTFLEGRVAKWWIPELIEFMDAIPRTSVGKFSKKTLRERFAKTGPPVG
ncbi:MAG: long-chain fatty acid--CoA ligase [Actinobacteria bacterium]|nr:long-chain fatty acid--CoA ligase [Actinomycetota bacterium]